MTSKKLLYQLDMLVQLCVGPEDSLPAVDRQASGDHPEGAIHDGRALLHALKNPPPLDIARLVPLSLEQPPITPDYTTGANHVLSVIHELIAHHRRIESAWQQRRIRLHQRLALLLFEQDVRQVLEWLDNHGELFLRKNTGIGKTLQRARVLQKSQLHFENVAKTTYTNAEKLLAAAEELAGTGECKPEEVYGVARELQRRISAFAKQMQARRHLLDLSVLFHTHYKEMLAWYDEIEKDEQECEVVGGTLQECEQKQDAWLARTDATLQAYATAVGEGQQLGVALRQQAAAEAADNTESCSCVEQMLGEIERRQTRLAERWQRQRLALQLGVKFALFQQDCEAVTQQLQAWKEDMRVMNAGLTPVQADKVLPLHLENTQQVHAAMLEIMSLANEQIQVLENSGLQLTTPDRRLVRDTVLSLADGVKQLEHGVMLSADQTSARLDQALQLGRLQALASQVVGWICKEEQVLNATLRIPTDVEDALKGQKEHRDFQLAVEKTNQNAVVFQEKAELMIACEHYESHRIRSMAEDVLAKWRRLVGQTEERNKLLTAAVTYYKSYDQVVLVLDNLEQDWSQQGRDWCSQFSTQPRNDYTPFAKDKTSFVSELLSKHMDYKERFMKGCSYARKNIELFLKHVRRATPTSGTSANAAVMHQHEARLLAALEQLHQRENRIRQLWTKKKEQLDRCQEFVLLEASAKNVLDWLHDQGEVFLSENQQHTFKTASKDQIEGWYEGLVSFKLAAKAQREKVRIFLGLADAIVTKTPSHQHANDIRQWMETVRQRFEDFTQRMEKLEQRMQSALGRPEKQSRDLALDRQSDPNLDVKLRAAKELKGETEEEMKLAKQMQCVMTELINTERAYVKDIKTCIDCYLRTFR
uniref:DH domain-containing protein n=1 Tax=Plectus sambesii TaxID=2011161 RepID=A0A914WMP7_9BILA